MKKLYLLIATTIILTACPNPNLDIINAPHRFVGYSYTGNLNFSEKKAMYSNYTHINLSFFNPDSSGEIQYSGRTPERDAELKEDIAKLNNSGQQVLIAIGGGISDGDPLIEIYNTVLQPVKRADFINQLLNMLDIIGADGIDVDLEHKCVNQYYTDLIKDLSAALKAKNKLLTCATSENQAAEVPSETFQYFDFINLMIYDYCGIWNDSPGELGTYKNVLEQLKHWTSIKKIPAEKLVIGVPYYGYWWKKDTDETTLAKGSLTYESFVKEYPDQIKSEDNFELISNDKTTTYYATNSFNTIIRKTRLSKYYGGIMCWQIDGDSPEEDFNLAVNIRRSQM